MQIVFLLFQQNFVFRFQTRFWQQQENGTTVPCTGPAFDQKLRFTRQTISQLIKIHQQISVKTVKFQNAHHWLTLSDTNE